MRAPRPSSSGPNTSATCSKTSSDTSTGHVVSPGVDVEDFASPTRRGVAQAARREPRRSPEPRQRQRASTRRGNAERFEPFFATEEPTVLYFGKLLRNKGVHVLLFEALREVDARAVIVGFGDYRDELERLAPERALFTGPLEHRHLRADPAHRRDRRSLDLPGGVRHGRRRGGRGGSLPLVGHHSGLAEIAAVAAEYPDGYGELASFETGNASEPSSREAPPAARPRTGERDQLAKAARKAVVDRWSWASVANRLFEPLA